MPSEEEMALAIKRALLGDRAELSKEGPWHEHELKPARAILALFAPILAEKAERDAYEAKLVETGKWLQELADNPPEPNEALKKLFAEYKASGIKSVGLDDDWEARALAAEAALAAAVAALEPFADEKNGAMQDLLWGDQPDTATGTITTRLGHIRKAREVVRAAAIRAQGEWDGPERG